MVLTIPEMHRHLEDLNQFYSQRTSTFISLVNSHPGKFTSNDLKQFADLIDDIRNDALTRISEYFNTKHEAKCQLYESEITSYSESGENVQDQLTTFRKQLEDATIDLKKEQNRRQNLLQFFSQKYSEHLIMKKAWKMFVENRNECKRAKQLDEKMRLVYKKNLLKKSFFPWRTLTYKQGYENTVKHETERDIQSIHEQYHSIIEILKTKIGETDEMIKIKRAAKGQFAFALSKNLLKSISNLSLQVMSLNQMALRDGENDESETKKFMQNVNSVIDDKLGKVRNYKKSLLGEQNEEGEQRKKKKKITFV